MSLSKIIEERYSCRAYKAVPVTDEQLDYIKECVRMAPSAVNRQPWRFRIIKSDDGKAKLRECYQRDWFANAPLYIVASVLHDEEWVRADGKHHGDIDVAIAVEHLCLAATEKGLGTCWVCNFDAALCKDLLNMGENEEPVVIIPIGMPDCQVTPKKRKETSDIFTEQ